MIRASLVAILILFGIAGTTSRASITVVAPVMSLAAGTYPATQSVSISDASSGAVIYYTTSGAAPTSSSLVYSGPLSIATTTPLRAIAILNGVASSVVTNVYTITPPASPTFSIPAGSYATPQSVSISDATPGATIFYTTNGVAPTTSSSRYSGSIHVSATTPIRAIAALPDGPASPVVTGVYTIIPPASPTFSIPAGPYATPQSVSISDATPGATIFYTTNGVAPTTSSSRYSGAIHVSATMPIRAIAALPDGPASPVVTNVYTITPPASPTFSIPAGSYATPQSVSISDATPGATIFYTTNGVAPTTSSSRYSGSIHVSATTPIRAIAALPDGPASPVVTGVYTITSAAAPTFSIPAGSYTGTQQVTITDSTSGAQIYYTTNGVAPTTSSARYTGPISVSSSLPLRAVAVYPNGPLSPVTTAVFTIIQAHTSLISPNATSSFWGLDINYLNKGTPWPTNRVGTIRLWNTDTNWGELAPTAETYYWPVLDGFLRSARANGADVIYTFGGVPAWALQTNLQVVSMVRYDGVVSVTTAKPHGFYYNPLQPADSQIQVRVAGASDGSFNGAFYLTSAQTANTFTFEESGSNASASEATISTICSGPYAPHSCAEPPADLVGWDHFVTALANHVGTGSVKFWEMWNEPNIPSFWKGDPMLLAAMVADARTAIKTVDPTSIVLSPGVAGNYETEAECSGYPSYCGSAWLTSWFADGGASLVDGIAFHGYAVIGSAPEQIQGATDLLHLTASKSGLGNLPLIDTESSWGTSSSLATSQDQQAWMARHLLLEHSMGIQRTVWYAYDSPSWGTLWTSSNGLTAAGQTYGVLEKWLTGANVTSACSPEASDPSTFSCSYARANGYVAKAIWNTAGSKSIAVDPVFTLYEDVEGVTHGISLSTVQVSTTPILLESSQQP